MRTKNIQTGRHRLGYPGTRHCIEIPFVAALLAASRGRLHLRTLLNRSRHRVVNRRIAFPVRRWVPHPAG
ncbi:hypothetical protein EBN03_23990 [Nocardia stercoris]|uniref:Uncharacterized protein n=1 Tax=Nocardia stercoris TaxID=2483361 RepID=A0A3M2KZJ5_9NOCA|nr:hypothetical protein EBN03_23990 [Nocardia stercoris]